MNVRDYDAMIAEAAGIGAEHGRAAGTWCYDGNTPDAWYRNMLRMDDDGDPAFWDALPSSPLSGEFAGNMTPRDLCEQIMGDENDPEHDADLADDLCRAYEDAWTEALRYEVLRACRVQTA